MRRRQAEAGEQTGMAGSRHQGPDMEDEGAGAVHDTQEAQRVQQDWQCTTHRRHRGFSRTGERQSSDTNCQWYTHTWPAVTVLEIVCGCLYAVLCMSHFGFEACMGSVVTRVHVSGCGHTAQHLRKEQRQQSRWERLDCCQCDNIILSFSDKLV
jgi:hypothetical protein